MLCKEQHLSMPKSLHNLHAESASTFKKACLKRNFHFSPKQVVHCGQTMNNLVLNMCILLGTLAHDRKIFPSRKSKKVDTEFLMSFPGQQVHSYCWVCTDRKASFDPSQSDEREHRKPAQDFLSFWLPLCLFPPFLAVNPCHVTVINLSQENTTC